MTIRDVRPGQTVFIRGERENSMAIHEAVVQKVGRKYVTLNDPWGSRFEEDYVSGPYLVGHVSYGSAQRLYLSRADADADVEAEKLRLWLMNVGAGWAQVRKYTLEQLRAVKQILGGDEHGSD